MKPGDDASHEEQKNYESAKNAYDKKIAILDKFDNGLAKLKESYDASKAALIKDSAAELAKLESEIGIVKPEPAKEGGTTTPGVTPAKPEDKPVATPSATAETATPAAAPAEKKETPKTAEYEVKKGDNLTKIAKEYGTTVSALAKENGIKNVNVIHVGQKLKVPAKAETPATDTEAAAASAKKPEAGKDGKAADGGKTEKKAAAPAAKPEASAAKPEAKAGEVPPSATTPPSEQAKVDAKPKSGPTDQTYAEVSQAVPKAAGGPTKSQKA